MDPAGQLRNLRDFLLVYNRMTEICFQRCTNNFNYRNLTMDERRWKEYFEELMNEENEMEKRGEGVNSVEQKVDKIRKDEVRKALKRMKSGKAVGPDDIPVEVWKCLGEAAVEFLTSLFNRALESERMPEEWRRSVLVPIFKNKGYVQSSSNYRGIKLMSHTMKLWERVVEARLRKVVEICEQQYGFMPRKTTTDAIFALRILMEKYRDGQRELHCVFVDLEKAYDRVPREELWYCMRKSGVAEKYLRVVQDMYERSRTVVRCAVGQTEEFKVEVGLHQGSALSPFLFAMVIDQLSEEVRQESPWTMMFADDIVICSENREQVEESLESWGFALERRGMKERCADNCAGKLIRSNHRLMGTYVQLMPAMVQRRMEEMESKAAEIAKATEAVGPVEPLGGGLNSSDGPSSVMTSTLATPPPGVQTPKSATEQAGTAATSGTIQSAPSLSTNEALGSPLPVPIVTESAHIPAAEPTVVVSSRQASLEVTSPHF
ncbi:hypothetical protein QTP70_018302 [Hemibagrus guttatus]|uniref:ribonuclease H n=1 Tax=Hemibagrus guttatus TaxID=175788 RepID=A0AAE0UW04_9TELE|nr:hypothetical protein QTP70_018302 [Hemibagrus guttatus]